MREPRAFDSAFEPEASNQSILCYAWNSREAHSRLEADPCLVDVDSYWSTLANESQERAIELPISGIFPSEELVQREPSAGMPNVLCYETLPAL